MDHQGGYTALHRDTEYAMVPWDPLKEDKPGPPRKNKSGSDYRKETWIRIQPNEIRLLFQPNKFTLSFFTSYNIKVNQRDFK